MKLESEDVTELIKYAFIGLIKNDGRFGLLRNGIIWCPTTLEVSIAETIDKYGEYIFKMEDFVNEKEYQEAKLELLKSEKAYFENKMNSANGQPYQIPIPKNTEWKVGE